MLHNYMCLKRVDTKNVNATKQTSTFGKNRVQREQLEGQLGLQIYSIMLIM